MRKYEFDEIVIGDNFICGSVDFEAGKYSARIDWTTLKFTKVDNDVWTKELWAKLIEVSKLQDSTICTILISGYGTDKFKGEMQARVEKYCDKNQYCD